MAINVDDVYKTVLYIINKEQRGYLTPEEFNKIATQVQLETFEKYFEDLNQQLRIPENDTEYANRVKNVDEKLDIFKTITSTALTKNVSGYFEQPTAVHKLGTVIYKDVKEVQRVQRNEYLLIAKSPLTQPTTQYPVYILEEDKIYVYPSTINNPDIQVSYIKKPTPVVWDYSTGSLGQYEFKDTTVTGSDTVNFELHDSEQTEVILNILMYAGVVIRDQQIVAVAAQKVQQEEVNEKS